MIAALPIEQVDKRLIVLRLIGIGPRLQVAIRNPVLIFVRDH